LLNIQEDVDLCEFAAYNVIKMVMAGINKVKMLTGLSVIGKGVKK